MRRINVLTSADSSSLVSGDSSIRRFGVPLSSALAVLFVFLLVGISFGDRSEFVLATYQKVIAYFAYPLEFKRDVFLEDL